jgi:hypothetical protein
LSYYLKPIRFLSIKVLCRIFQSAKLHSKSLKKAACAKSVPNMSAQAIFDKLKLDHYPERHKSHYYIQ